MHGRVLFNQILRQREIRFIHPSAPVKPTGHQHPGRKQWAGSR
jgi:hypothetical protein